MENDIIDGEIDTTISQSNQSIYTLINVVVSISPSIISFSIYTLICSCIYFSVYYIILHLYTDL